ncbi:MAG: hypothetical protein ACLFPQ_04495 [Candidatus Woesearchaeota archaeon]
MKLISPILVLILAFAAGCAMGPIDDYTDSDDEYEDGSPSMSDDGDYEDGKEESDETDLEIDEVMGELEEIENLDSELNMSEFDDLESDLELFS